MISLEMGNIDIVTCGVLFCRHVCFGLQMRTGSWATLGYFSGVVGAMTSEKSGNPERGQGRRNSYVGCQVIIYLTGKQASDWYRLPEWPGSRRE